MMDSSTTIRNSFKIKHILKSLLGSGLYYADLGSDFLMAIDLYLNCHYNYLIFCAIIIVLSYLTTIVFLKFRGLAENFRIAVFYPYYQMKYFFQDVKLLISNEVSKNVRLL